MPLSGAMPASRVPLATTSTPSSGPGSFFEQPSSAWARKQLKGQGDGDCHVVEEEATMVEEEDHAHDHHAVIHWCWPYYHHIIPLVPCRDQPTAGLSPPRLGLLPDAIAQKIHPSRLEL